MTYAADRDMFLRLGADSVTFYEAKLDKSAEFVEKCVPWSEFVGATSTATSTAAEAAKHAHSIRIVMKSTEETRGHFNIAAIGKFDVTGACEVDGFADVVTKTNGAEIGTIILRSSSSSGVSGSSSSLAPFGDCVSPESVSEMWYGPKAVDKYDYHVATGLDNGTETSGYWFSFDDDKANTYVKWPVMQLEYENIVERAIEVCEGICGTFIYKDEGVLGIGFNVAGEALSGNNGAPDIAKPRKSSVLCSSNSWASRNRRARSTSRALARIRMLNPSRMVKRSRCPVRPRVRCARMNLFMTCGMDRITWVR